ncbi:hypothetical protein RRG08_041163 [Elysia crispata]|uniref:Uncharacterized protein n=1 Tax=Elysia crispata TaxID=231223 RepID=A0AAE1CPB1_9GAST|nr:hypothetical protein RRG08_041163 [Elysia crispata]
MERADKKSLHLLCLLHQGSPQSRGYLAYDLTQCHKSLFTSKDPTTGLEGTILDIGKLNTAGASRFT